DADGTCAARPDEGEPCEFDSDCQEGLRCDYDIDTSESLCTPRSRQRESCSSGSDCVAGLYCAAGADGMTCAAQNADGAECMDDTECDHDRVGADSTTGTPGVCGLACDGV
ncbi:MAG: hypothetical protein D6689_08385, partial [Deltaproteobacteria bacterium]